MSGMLKRTSSETMVLSPTRTMKLPFDGFPAAFVDTLASGIFSRTRRSIAAARVLNTPQEVLQGQS